MFLCFIFILTMGKYNIISGIFSVLLILKVEENLAQQLQHQAPRITYLHVQSDIKARFATTLVTSKVVNLDRSPREVIFDVIIPDKAFISGFNLDIDGRIYPSEVKEKESARKKYINARSRGLSAGQISRRPRETNKFLVEVNIAPRSVIIFNLTYEEFLQRNKGIYKHMIYIDPGQIVDDLRVDVSLKETRPITTLRVPPLTSSVLQQSDSTAGNSEATIVKPTPNTAEIDFRSSVEDQKRRSSQGISGQFAVEYDIEREHDVGDMLVVDGYFVHYFAPEGLNPIPKDVVFVLDTSGSMGGQKIAQLKTAMDRILSDLHENDRFTIISFSSSVGYFRRGLIQATSKNVDYAKAYMRRIRADGGTNINDGVLNALRFINNIADREGRSPIVVFLTDGQATSGETNNAQILENVKKLNGIDVPIFSLAFGRDADYEFVKTVSVQNHGIGKKIYETSDADLQISGFYDEISVSLFRNISVRYSGDEVNEDNVTQTHFNTYFRGSEIVVAGVVKDRNVQNLDASIDGVGSNGSIDFATATLTSSEEILENAGMNDGALSDEAAGVFSNKKDAKRTVEKIWSHVTLREILRKLKGESNVQERETLKKKALEISLKYGIVTPLTSLVVSKPDEQDLGYLQGDEADLGSPPPTLPPPGTEPDDSQSESKKRRRGRGGGYGGGGDPHFMVHIPGLDIPICFDIMAKPGEFLRILKDPLQGMIINAATIPTKTVDKFGKLKTYIGEIFIKSKDIILVVTPKQIIFNGNFLSWLDGTPSRHGIVDIQIQDSGYILAVHLRRSISVVIRRIPASDQHPSPYLNIFIQNKNALSLNATGILGQFAHKHVKLKKINERGGKTVGKFSVHKGNRTFHFKTNLKHKHAYIDDKDYPCWNAHRSISGLIDGQLHDYIIQSFFDET